VCPSIGKSWGTWYSCRAPGPTHTAGGRRLENIARLQPHCCATMVPRGGRAPPTGRFSSSPWGGGTRSDSAPRRQLGQRRGGCRVGHGARLRKWAETKVRKPDTCG
jgi:hypothetical protein